jgi:hypothetical protein
MCLDTSILAKNNMGQREYKVCTKSPTVYFGSKEGQGVIPLTRTDEKFFTPREMAY